MTELPPEAAALLESARRSHGPSDADRRRVLAGLHASLGIGGAVTPSPPGGEAAAASQGATGASHALFTWKMGKVLVTAMAVGGGVGASHLWLPPERPAAPAPVVASAAEAPDVAVHGEQQAPAPARRPARSSSSHPVQRAAALPVSAPAEPVRERASAPAPAAAEPASPVLDTKPGRGSHRSSSQRERRRSARERRRNAADPAAFSVQASAEDKFFALLNGPSTKRSPRELDLIRAALTSLRDREPLRALKLLDEHAERYPSGAFVAERRGLRVVALCAAGRVQEGQHEQAAFLDEAGSSPIAARVRRACGGSTD